MLLTLNGCVVDRGGFRLACTAGFGEGVHLVSGRTGSGKTTLSYLCAGLIPPDTGSVTSEGIRSSLISFQFPEYHVTGNSVEEEIRSWGADPDPVLTSLSLRGREEDDPFTLSRGELTRVELACVLSADPDLLILDEPFSALDGEGKEWLCERVEGRKSGITIICSHEQSVLPAVDEIWEVDGGEVIPLGAVPGALGRWRYAPPYLRLALRRGAAPANITIKAVEEAACRIRG